MRIREMRERANLTQKDLAVEMGMDRSAIAKWEAEAALPTADKLPKLAQVLGCTIDELFRA